MKNVRRAEFPHWLCAVAMIVAGIAFAVPALAETHKELQQVERELQAARERAEALELERRKAAQDLARLRAEAIAAARKTQQHEARLIELDASLKSLTRRDTEARIALSRRNFEMAGTLAALERIARNPPQTMLAFPDAPTRMVRSAMLLRGALPRVRQEADSLAAELKKLAAIREETRLQLAAVEEESLRLKAEQDRLAELQTRKGALLKRTEAETREMNRRTSELAKRAASIRELMAQIEAERKRRAEEEVKRKQQEEAAGSPSGESLAMTKPSGLRTFPNDGPIPSPTSAPIVLRYGERAPNGQTARGITFGTRPGAQIVAPFDGQVVFAGPFEGYAQILIIEHDGGYHTLLAGLERLDAAAGQWVLAGEPVGAMGEGAIGTLGEIHGLYLELRRAGHPINPLRWLAGDSQNRTSG